MSAEDKQGSKVLQHGAIYALGSMLSRMGGFLLLPLYLKALSPVEYGVLEMFYAISSVLALLVSGGLSQAALRFYYEYDEPGQRNAVISTALLSSIVFSGLGALLLWPFSHQGSYLLVGTPEYASSFKLVLLTLIVQMANEVGLSYLRVKGYVWRFVVASLSLLVLQVIINLYTVLTLRWGVPGVLLGNLLGATLGCGIVTAVTLRDCGLHFRRPVLSRMLQYTWPMVVAGIAGVFMDRADRFILERWLGLEAVGIYGLAEKLALIFVMGFLRPFELAYGVHRFAIIKSADRAEQQARAFRQYLFSAALVGLVIVVFTPPVLRLIAAPSYWAAVALLPILMVRYIVIGTEYIFHTGILYAGRTRFSMGIHLSNGAVRLAFTVAFIGLLGIQAPAFGALAGSTCAAIAALLISRRFDPVNWNLSLALRIGVLCAACFFVDKLTGEGWLSAAAAASAYLLGAFALGIITRGDVARAMAWVSQHVPLLARGK
ncbi:MAG TPA: oligosaccharide flippase family protein [Steroidobacteraceae bacterium]|nr:oligosaccharide flippase family protein [Steroidobacteraceae bacterium]